MDLEPGIATTILLTIRWFLVLRLQPHWSLAVGRAWWPLAAGLAFAMASLGASAGATASLEAGWAVAIAAEVLLGAAIGVLISLPAYALLGGAAASASALRTVPGPFVRLCVSGALVAALALGMHHVGLTVVRDQSLAWPPGDPSQWVLGAQLLPVLVTQLDAMLLLALTLATPVLLTTCVLRAAVAVVGTGPGPAASLAAAVGPTAAALGAVLAFAASWAVYPVGWARAVFPG
jgi:flagellar biosynthesis protein FliR